MSTYLDYNATTPVHPRVLEAMVDVYQNHFGNADSRTHVHGNDAQELVETARKQVAELLGIHPYEVIFTSGTTESNNMAILGMADWGRENGKTHIITTSFEHKAVLEPLRLLEQQGFAVEYLDPARTGRVEADEVLSRLRPETLMVCMMHANNETGVVQPVLELGEALGERGIFFLVDAAQTCGKLVEELRACPYTFLSASAHKLHGPQGVGVLIVRREGLARPPIRPILLGGGQESGLRPGTLPVALIVGMGLAARIAQDSYAAWQAQTARTKALLLDLLEESSVRYQINGTQEHCMPNTINVSFSDVDSEGLMIALKGTCSISNGSACTASDYAPSFVLRSMGLPEERVESAVRLSWDVEDVSAGLVEILKAVQALQTV